MFKCKIFFACILCFVLLLAGTTIAVEKSPISKAGDERLVVQLPYSGGSHNPGRDQDDFMTYRWRVSTDGGANWSDIQGAGDTGMWEEDGVPGWGNDSYFFSAAVDGDNNLHFVGPMDAYTFINNPDERMNGVYDIKIDAEGEATYTMIAVEGEGDNFTFADVGVDAEGTLYAIWMNWVVPDEGAPYANISASKSEDGGDNWSDPFVVIEELGLDNIPHMAYHVGDFIYILYQVVNAETELYDQYVLKVSAALEGEVANLNTGVSSGTYSSYYRPAVKPIDQDPEAGFVYFCIRNEDLSGTTVVNSEDGGDNWVAETVPGAQRYPSIGLDMTPENVLDRTPWVFSNFGITEPWHHNWYSYDELGYNGGSWIEPTPLDSTEYPGEVLYFHMGVWTSEGILVSGNNVWNYPTPVIQPSRYIVNTSDDGGENWSGTQQILSIWDDGIQGGYIADPFLVTGQDNHVWMVFAGQYGYTDIIPPTVVTTDLSSFMLGEDKIVTVEASDNVDIYQYPEGDPLEGIWDVWIDFYKVSDDTMDDGTPRWVPVTSSYDSCVVDENGIGTYYFHLQDALQYMSDVDTTDVNLEAGDVINFYSYCWDGSSNLGIEHNGDWENVWTVNEGWTKVKDSDATVPVKFEVGQNYPNPFNNSTVIPFSLNRPSNVTVSVYDVNGRLVDTIFQGQVTAGQHSVAWLGEGVTSGVYIYTLEADNVRHVGKMTLLR